MSKSKSFTLQDIPDHLRANNPHLFPTTQEKEENVGKHQKKSKYGNKKAMVDGEEIDSIKEANRYKELKLLLKQGKIGMLARQVEFVFHLKGEKIASYFCDFMYMDSDTGEQVIEDVKSAMTRKLPTYRLKRRLMWAQFRIRIKEY